MYHTLLLPEKYDKIRNTTGDLQNNGRNNQPKTDGIDTLQYIYEIDCMGELVNQDLSLMTLKLCYRL